MADIIPYSGLASPIFRLFFAFIHVHTAKQYSENEIPKNCLPANVYREKLYTIFKNICLHHNEEEEDCGKKNVYIFNIINFW